MTPPPSGAAKAARTAAASGAILTIGAALVGPVSPAGADVDNLTVTDFGDSGAGTLRDLGSRAVNLLAMGVLLSHPHDTQCGLKAFRSDVAKTVFALGRVDRFAFDIEVLHLVERHGFTVVEVPVRLDMGERSTVRLARDTARLLRDLWRIRHWSATGAYELAPETVAASPVG